MSKYDVNNVSIGSIIGWIESGEIAIPEIQRPFIWDSTKVRDLIDSLYQGYPVGYIIIWKNPDIKQKDGTLSQGKKILIDGQQRITALTAAIVGNEVVDENYRKKRISISFNPIEERFEVQNPAILKNKVWIPNIAALFENDFNAYSFVKDYCSHNNITDEKETGMLSDVINKVKSIKNNSIGVIELSHALDIETVTEIFIRINSKGVVLSQADFVMSKISSNEEYGGDIIRKVIDYFCHLWFVPEDLVSIENNDHDFSGTDDFKKLKWIVTDDDYLYAPEYSDVLRVAFAAMFTRGKLSDLVSLLSGRDFVTREYKEEIAEDSFNKLHLGVLKYVNQTNFTRFTMIIKSLGIIDNSMIRSQNVLNFGYSLYLLLREKGIDSAIIEKAVRKWILLSILTARYSGSAETRFDADIKMFSNVTNPFDVISNVEAGDLSDAFWTVTILNRLSASMDSSPFFKLFLAAQVKSNDKGFLSEEITVQTMIEGKGDIHHLFPKKYLQNNGRTSKNEYNQIANYAYTQTEINIKIKDRAPSDYMETIYKQCETGTPALGGITDKSILSGNLKMNCIPVNFVNYDIDDYDQFLSERRILIAAKIRSYYESF